jgi:uncharacterized protein YcbK (DUF882 family)
MPTSMCMRRRRRLLAALAAGWLAAPPPRAASAVTVQALPPDDPRRPRELWITRPQAQETVRAVYWADGVLQPDGYRSLTRIYRDLQAGVERPIALALLDLNHALQRAVWRESVPHPLILLSGYRTPATNRLVGGVEPSAHLAGQADDFIYERLSLLDNIRLARRFQVGGLGIYPDRGSLHKDIGARRTWVEFGRAAPVAGPIRINPERINPERAERDRPS